MGCSLGNGPVFFWGGEPNEKGRTGNEEWMESVAKWEWSPCYSSLEMLSEQRLLLSSMQVDPFYLPNFLFKKKELHRHSDPSSQESSVGSRGRALMELGLELSQLPSQVR